VNVYLLRHAIAEERDAARWPDDSLRPLSENGVERFRRAARGLQRIAPSVDVLLASPYVRAWQTAGLVRDEAAWPEPDRCPALSADRSTAAALEPLRQHARHESVALVGHEPNLSALASLLLAGADDTVALDLKKGGIVLLTLSATPAPGSAVLRWSVPPKILRALA
jgi:phosphohistidine phosphatase